VTINGSFDVLPRSRGFNFVDWHPLRLTIHAPIEPSAQGADAERAVMREAFDVVHSALEEKYKSKKGIKGNKND
jgi:1-acyl-sn-glycerol-3-phosphate acyltransferase